MESRTGSITRVVWRFAQCEYDELRAQLWVAGSKVDLHPKTQAVLLALLKSKDHMMTKRDLLRAVWGSADAVEQPLANAIARLRTAVSPDERDMVIRTLHGVGFQIIVPVERRSVEESLHEGTRLAAGDSIPGKRDWKLVTPLDSQAPHCVWLAQRPATGHTHVFKLAEDGAALLRLKKEVEVYRRLEERRVDMAAFVPMFDWRDTTRPYFLETEYCGQNLVEWAEAQRMTVGLRPEICVQVFLDLVDAVAIAHGCAILHNRIEPGNVLVATPLGGDDRWRVKLANFGSATLDAPDRADEAPEPGLDERRVLDGNGQSSLYRAPEIAAGGASTRASDLYSLGVILFQLLCGDFYRPLTPDWMEFIDDPTLRSDISEATSSDPRRRIRSAAELANRLRTREARSARDRELAREMQLIRARAELAERQVTVQNARRPWIVAAILLLLAGVCASLWYYRRAARERDIADRRNTALAAMNDFLEIDLIGESDPLSGSPRARPPAQETLLEAMNRALPQIDRRFQQAPEIAGQLHESIAAALDARTEYSAAAQEFATAGQRFRKAEGPLSQNAMIAELRRENVLLRMQQPAAIAEAKASFQAQQPSIAKLPYMTPELQAYEALAQTGWLIYAGQPQGALQVLTDAVHRAQATPNFPAALLIKLNTRFCGIYLGMADGKDAERVARNLIAAVAALHGQDSPELFQLDGLLEEALFLQGKQKETIEQSARDYERFRQGLGPDNQLTLASLYMHAQAEAAVENYDDAIRDNLEIYATERANPSGVFNRENALSAAALMECHAGHIAAGIQHARQTILESGPQAAAQPVFTNFATFVEAECLIAQEETSGTAKHPAALAEAGHLLKGIDVPVVARTPGLADFEGAVDLAEARLALLQGQRETAQTYVSKAAPFLQAQGADGYQRKVLSRVQAALSQ